MTNSCDTIKIHAQRSTPVVTSVQRMAKPDHDWLCKVAEHLTSAGGEGAAAGRILGDGRALVLKRMHRTMEVRGVVLPHALSAGSIRTLLDDHPFWAGQAFVQGRPATLDVPAGTSGLTVPWCTGLPVAPRGFRELSGTASPTKGAAPGPAAAPGAGAHQPITPPTGFVDDQPARWPLVSCTILTFAASAFMGWAIFEVVTRMPPERTGTVVIAPPTAPPQGAKDSKQDQSTSAPSNP